MEGSSSMTNIYPRESVEFQPVLVTLDNVSVTSNVQIAVLKPTDRPVEADWFAATVLNGEVGFLTGTYAYGTWNVWARVVGSPEEPVINCGSIQIS